MVRAEDIKANLEQAMRGVLLLQGEHDHYKTECAMVYEDVGRLGEALGHIRCARPESASSLMSQWIDEVKAMVTKYEPERHRHLAEEKERAWRLT